jgi:hypothetical protein
MVLLETGHAGKGMFHVGELLPARDRDTVPLRVPVVGDLVAERGEPLGRELVVLALGLLQGQDVDVAALQPADDAVDPRASGVHVPGSQTHAKNRTRRCRHLRAAGAAPTSG